MAVLTFQMHHVRLNDDVSQAAPKWRHLHPPCARGGRARPGGSGADRRDQVNNYLWHLITLATWCDLLRAANGGNRPGVIAGIGLTRFSYKWTSHWWQINQTRLKRISAWLWWPLGLLHYAIEPFHMRRVCCWKYIYFFEFPPASVNYVYRCHFEGSVHFGSVNEKCVDIQATSPNFPISVLIPLTCSLTLNRT